VLCCAVLQVVRDAESDDTPGDQDADSSRKRNVHSRDGSCNEGQVRTHQQARHMASGPSEVAAPTSHVHIDAVLNADKACRGCEGCAVLPVSAHVLPAALV
jgi:hypothetical protein